MSIHAEGWIGQLLPMPIATMLVQGTEVTLCSDPRNRIIRSENRATKPAIESLPFGQAADDWRCPGLFPSGWAHFRVGSDKN